MSAERDQIMKKGEQADDKDGNPKEDKTGAVSGKIAAKLKTTTTTHIIAGSTVIQAISTCVLVLITAYYAWETSRIRSENTAVAKANREMAETAQQNLRVSQDMLLAARETIKEMQTARQEQMRPYLSYQPHTFYREGVGHHYMVWLVNQGMTPAKDITILPNSSNVTIQKTISFLGPKQNTRVLWTRHDHMKEQNIPRSFDVKISYRDLNERKYEQTMTIEVGDRDPNSLGSIDEKLFDLNMKIDDFLQIYKSETLRKSREK